MKIRARIALAGVFFAVIMVVNVVQAAPGHSWSVSLLDRDNRSDVAAAVSGEVVIYEESFDEPPMDWSGLVRPDEDGWHWKFTNSEATGMKAPYVEYVYEAMMEPPNTGNTPIVSPPIDVSEYNQVFVSVDAGYISGCLPVSNSWLIIEVSLDGGSSWQELARLEENDTRNLSQVFAVGDATDLLIRAHHDVGGEFCSYAVVQIDNVKVIGIGDLPADGDGYTYSFNGPFFGLEGQPCEVEARIMPDHTLASACIEHGIFDGEVVSDMQCSEMHGQVGEESDLYIGQIPGDAAAPGQTVAWRVRYTDVAGSVWYKPDGSATPEDNTDDWYAYTMYDGAVSWNDPQIRNGNWWSYSGPWAFGPDVQPSSEQFWPPEQYQTQNPGFWDPTPMICTVPNGPYPDGTDGYLTLNFNIVPGPNAIFAWTYLLDTPYVYGGAPDGYNVQINVDGGGWQVVNPILPYDGDVMAFEFYSQPGFYYPQGPTSNAVDLSSFNGSTVQLRFRFADDGSNAGGYDGVSFLNFLLSGATFPGYSIEGTVTDGSATPIDLCDITVYPPDMTVPEGLQRTYTAQGGYFYVGPMDLGDHVVSAAAPGLEPKVSSVITVNDASTSTCNFQLDVSATDHNVAGEVVEGAGLTAVGGAELSLGEDGPTTISGPDGSFDFGPVTAGVYDLKIKSVPPGSQGLHNTFFPAQVINSDTPALQYAMPPIGQPQMPLVIPGNGTIQTVVPLPLGAPELTRVEDVEPGAPPRKTPPCKGYRVRLDGYHILPEIFPAREFTIKGLENGHEYSIEIAEDYGYGDEYLVWSDPVNATPNTMLATITNPTYEWVEIRPGFDGLGYDLYVGTYSDVSNIGGTFNYFGTDYTSLRVYGDGVIAFDQSAQINYFWPELGNPAAPNALVAPYWIDLAPGYNSGESAWFWYDDTNNRAVVQWHAPHYTTEGPVNNADFEVIFDFDDNSITFQYMTTESGWSTDALVGFEDPEGNLIALINSADIVDGFTVQLASLPPSYGTVSGHVVDPLGDPVEGAEISVAGDRPQTWSNGNGDWVATLMEGTYDLVVRLPGCAPVRLADATVTESTDLPLGTQTLYKVSGEVNTHELELSVPLDEVNTFSTSFTLTNTGDAPMQSMAWWTELPAYEREAQGSTPPTQPQTASPAVKWIGDGVSKRMRPVMRGESVAPAKGPLQQTTSFLDPLFHFNATTAVSPYAYDLFGVAMTTDGIHLSDYGPSISLYTFDRQDPYAYQSQIEFPDGLQMINGFATDPVNNCMISVDNMGRVWRFNSDLTVLEQIGRIGFEANGCAYNYMTNELYAYFWGEWGGNPERFIVYNLSTGEIRDLAVPHDIGLVSDLAFVPNDPDGLFIHALAQYHDKVSIHRYNQRHDFWEQEGQPVMYFASQYWDIAGFSATPLISMNETTTSSDLVAETRMDYVVASLDQNGYTYVDAWRGPKVPTWLLIQGPAEPLAPTEAGTFTVSVDLSLDPTFMPEPQSDSYVEIRPTAADWSAPPVVTLVVHWGALGSKENAGGLPEKYALHPAYPNPFNPTATLKYDLPEPAKVTMTVHNILGQKVATLVDGLVKPAGYHSVRFDGGHLATGVYFVRLDCEAYTKVRKMVLLK